MKNIPNLTFLRYFMSAAELGSISKAAKKHFVTQSAISQAIGKLELTLGKQLITHEKNRFQLTSEGRLLLEKGKQIFAVFSEIEDAFDEADDIYRGKLALACTHSFALSFLPPHLSQLASHGPKIEFALRLGHTGMVVELVKRGEVDFGIVLDNDDFSDFSSEEIFRGEYRLYQAKKLRKSPLNKFIFSEERKEVSLVRCHLDRLGIEIQRCIEVSSWEVIATLAEQGLGVGLLPDYIARKRALIPCSLKIPSIPYRILAIFSKHHKLSRNGALFLHLMKG